MDVNTTEADIRIEPRVAVVGLGGAGCNVVDTFCKALAPVDTIAINTDKKALDETVADKKIYICKAVTQGHGTNGDARLGKKCAQAHEAMIESELAGYNIAFIITGLGGGTGTGAASEVVKICNRLGIMTFMIGINPFSFETDRVSVAREGLRHIRAVCLNVFTIENDKAIEMMPDATMGEALSAVNRSIITYVDETVTKVITGIKAETEAVRDKCLKRNSGRMSEIRTGNGIRMPT